MGTRTPLEVVYESYRQKDLKGQSRTDQAQLSRYINTGLQSSNALISQPQMGSRAIDYVKMTKRDSHNVSREVDKMNGILFDIKQKKKYEEELKNRFSDALNTPAGE